MANDEQALREIVAQLEAAWNKGDSVTWTSFFAEDADFVHILGGHFTGQAAIEAGHRTIFDTIYKGSTLKLEVEKIRFAGDAVAIVFIFSTLLVTQPGVPPKMNARPTLMAQRQDSQWKIVAFQNTLVSPEGAPAGQNPLVDRHPIKGQGQAAGH